MQLFFLVEFCSTLFNVRKMVLSQSENQLFLLFLFISVSLHHKFISLFNSFLIIFNLLKFPLQLFDSCAQLCLRPLCSTLNKCLQFRNLTNTRLKFRLQPLALVFFGIKQLLILLNHDVFFFI